MAALFVAVAAAALSAAAALLNGLGNTPQMGYNSWYDLMMSPSEAAVRATAAAMLANGLHAAGYRWLNLDDGWCATTRDANGNLQADPTAFPNGIKEVATWLNTQGYGFGVYTDRGTNTCGGRMGAQGHEAQDAQWYVDNGVQYLKEDSCYASTDQQTAYAQYAAMRDGLAAAGGTFTNTTVFFSLCGWEAWYSPVLHALGNSARIGPDDTNYNGILSDIDDMAPLWPSAGPGGWNDPCLLLGADATGVDAVTEQQSRFQFTAWAVLAAPMLLSQNVRNMSAFRLATYTNAEVIAVGQDPMGRQGARLAGGPLSLAPRSMQAHLERRHGTGKIPDPRKLYSPAQVRRMRGVRWGDNDAPLTAMPCTGATPQQWQWNVTAPGYLSNVATQLCANVDDCGSELIAYTCVTTGGTCMGPDDYSGLQFALAADGTLRTPSAPGQCVTQAGNGVQLTLEPCTPNDAAQQWAYDTGKKTLSQPDSGYCVTVGGPSTQNATAVFGRPLADGSLALAFLNSGLTDQSMGCDVNCLTAATGWEPQQVLSVRDLWAGADLADTTVAQGVAAGQIAADGGAALFKVTPKFNTTIPTAEAW